MLKLQVKYQVAYVVEIDIPQNVTQQDIESSDLFAKYSDEISNIGIPEDVHSQSVYVPDSFEGISATIIDPDEAGSEERGLKRDCTYGEVSAGEVFSFSLNGLRNEGIKLADHDFVNTPSYLVGSLDPNTPVAVEGIVSLREIPFFFFRLLTMADVHWPG